MKEKREKKSVAAAVLLGLFLGPIGTFYTGWKTFLVFMLLLIGGIIGIVAITGTAFEDTMAQVEAEVFDESEAAVAELGAAAGAGIGFVLLLLPYLAILGLAAIITNVVSCQRHNNRVEQFLHDEAERRHQELMSKGTET